MDRAKYSDVAWLKDANNAVKVVPGARVTLYDAGTTAPISGAAIFAGDTGGTTLGNPFLADSSGGIEFFLATARPVKIKIEDLVGGGSRTVDLELVFADPSLLATTDSVQTFLNKTLTSPTINGGTQTGPTLSAPTINNGTINSASIIDAAIDNAAFTGNVYSNGLILRPELHGAAADWQHNAGASMSASSNQKRLTLGVTPSPPLAAGMVVCVQGAGAAGADLITTIDIVNSTTSFDLVASCLTTVSGAAWEAGTDCTTPFNNWWQALLASPGFTGELHGTYMAGNLDWTEGHGVSIRGHNFIGFAAANPLNRGSAIMAKPGLTGKWIDISGGSHLLMEKWGLGRSDQKDWSATPDVAFYCSSLVGIEATVFNFRDMYVSGTYNISTFYFNQCFEIEMERVFVYNYHPGTGRCLTLTANNRDNLTSDLGNTQHSTSAYIPSGQFSARECQFNQVGWTIAGYNPASDRTGYCVDLDSWLDAEFDHCLFTGGNRAIRIKDESAAANEQTRMLTLINPTFENPGQTGNLGMRGAFYLDSNVITENVVIINPYFNLTDTTPSNAAWIKDGSNAGTTTAIKDWTIIGPKSVAGTETGIFINQTAAGAGLRVIACDLDLAGRGGTFSGSIDEITRWTNEGTLTVSGGGAINDSWGWATGGPLARNGLKIAARGLRSLADRVLLAFIDVGSAVNGFTITNATTGNPPELAATGTDTNISLKLTAKGTGALRVPAWVSGTPNANELYQQSIGKAHGRFVCAAGTCTLVYGHNVSGTVTINSDGDYTFTVLRGFLSNSYVWTAIAISNNRLYACVTTASLSDTTVRIQVVDAAGTITLPDGLFIRADGMQ